MFQHPYLIPQGGSVQTPTFYPDSSHYFMHQPQQFSNIYGNGVGHMRDMTFNGATLRGVPPVMGAQVNNNNINNNVEMTTSPLPQTTAKTTSKTTETKQPPVMSKEEQEKKNAEEKAKIRKQQWFTSFFMAIIVAITVYFMYSVVG